MPNDFAPADKLWDIFRKLLAIHNEFVYPPSSSATQFAPGDTLWTLSRKLLIRLSEIVPSTGDTLFQAGDSQWALWRKILEVLNRSEVTVPTDAMLFRPGDGLEEISRKILDRVNQLAPLHTGTDVIFRPGDFLHVIWRKILRLFFTAAAEIIIAVVGLECMADTDFIDVAGAGTAAANGRYLKFDVVTYVNAASNYFITVLNGAGGFEAGLYRFDAVLMYSIPAGGAFPCDEWEVNAGDGPPPIVVFGECADTTEDLVPTIVVHYVGAVAVTLDVLLPKVCCVPGSVVIYESDNGDMSGATDVDIIPVTGLPGEEGYSISGIDVSAATKAYLAVKQHCLVGVVSDYSNVVSAETVVIGSPAYDSMELYTDGASVDGLNAGIRWAGPYFARESYVRIYAHDSFETYTNGAAVAGLNGGIGWSGVYAT